MDMKNNMMCDLETGICGPGGDSVMEFIDLSAPLKTSGLSNVIDPGSSVPLATEPILNKPKD